MKNQNAKRFKENQNKKNYKNIFIILFIILIFILLYFIFNKSFNNTLNKISNNTNNITNTNNSNFDNIKKNVTNYETLEASNLKIKVGEGQSSVSITIKNTSSEICPKLILSILLVDSKNESVITFDAYTSEIEPNKEQILQMYTKRDISNVTDFSIYKEAK